MKIIPIFENRLYSVHYDEKESSDEFERLFDDWQDPQFLEAFFNAHESDLKSGFFGSISIHDAIVNTRQEALKLQDKFLELASDSAESLNGLFRPLDKESSYDDFEKSKAKGDRHKSWLRVYAIKIDPGVYVITGGSIKLTRAMGERDHTKLELAKLKRCMEFLKENGISDIEGFLELVNE